MEIFVVGSEKHIRLLNLKEDTMRELKGIMRQYMMQAFLQMSVQFSHDERMIVSGSNDCVIVLWDVTSGKRLKVFDKHVNGVYRARFSPDDKFIVSDSTSQIRIVLSMESVKQLKIYNDLDMMAKLLYLGEMDTTILKLNKNKNINEITLCLLADVVVNHIPIMKYMSAWNNDIDNKSINHLNK
ncbi:WD-40 repeat protein [Reticulomyxa filosa]|uniref:WD-40 repeat protein n=1 Tax=Reticulomyxa filosa TaxID=46433 RepID=X6LJY7_RETFI|nr:WD-40 repeat protein [Reticulomyxa filosa]|eukprot:ETO01442.1 WD-40 repeat protein [Reticulomyxa filosa]